MMAVFARNHRYPLDAISVTLTDVIADNPTRIGGVDASVSISGELSAEQRAKLQKIAAACKVSDSLKHPMRISVSFDPAGDFTLASGEFRFDVSATSRPARPWINVLANPDFGAQVSETGGGYSWAVNSRLNQLTAWSNDPVSDPPAEWFVLQDRKTQQAWSVAPSAWGDASLVYRVAHGQGTTLIVHRRGDLEVRTTWCVDSLTSVKQVRLRMVNRGQRTLRLRLTGIAEWMMGATRADRGTVHTALVRQRLGAGAAADADGEAGAERHLTALLCTQRETSAGFGDGTAFLALADSGEATEDWTCDRRECFDARRARGACAAGPFRPA